MSELISSSTDLPLTNTAFHQLYTDEPDFDVPIKTVAFHIIEPSEIASSPFWLGLFKPGKLRPQSLLEHASSDAVLEQAASVGLSEEGPFMLTDSSAEHSRNFYLLPVPGDDLTARAKWIHDLATTVKSWSPTRVGIYLAPELISKEKHEELFMQMMRELIVSSETTDFFLYPGSYGINHILNASLRIKTELDQDNIAVYVFH